MKPIFNRLLSGLLSASVLLSYVPNTEITSVALNEVENNCSGYKVFKNGYKGWICEGKNDCVIVSQYMQFCIMGKSIAEQKYISLAKDRSGLLGLFGYNPLDNSESTLKKASNNIERMETLLSKYARVYAA